MWIKVKQYLKNYIKDIQSIPSILLTIFIVVLIAMNILANKTIYQNEFIAIDGGLVIGWIAIIILNVVIAVCGPKIAIKMSTFGLLVTLLVSLIFFLVSLIPSGAQFEDINRFLGGTWFIILSSVIAFLCSSIFNAFLNYLIGKSFKKNPEGKLAFAFRSYISIFVSRVFDNFLFSFLAFVVFAPFFWDGFHWTVLQCVFCALLHSAIELVIVAVVFPLFFKLYKHLLAKHNNKQCENK